MRFRCLGLGAALWAAWGAGAAAPPPQKLLPDTTVFLVTMPDSTQAWNTVTNSALARLWRDPAMKGFTDKFNERLKTAVVGPLEQELGIHFADYQGLARGQLTLALIPVEHPDDPAKGNLAGNYAAVFLLDAEDHSGQLATNLAALKKKWIDAGKTLKTEKIRDTDFATFITSSDDLSVQKLLPDLVDTNDPGDQLQENLKITVQNGRVVGGDSKAPPEKVELTFGQSGSLLLVSQSREVIEKILARQAGGLIPALEEQPAFQADYAARLQGAPIYAWFNLKALVGDWAKERATPSGKPAAESAPATDVMMSELGFNSLTSASITYRATAEGLSVRFFVGAPESGRCGLLKILGTEAENSGPPPFVPSDVVKFSRVRLDIPGNWKVFESTLNQLNPKYAQSLNYVFGLVGKDKDEKYDLRAELLGSLGDDIIAYQRSPLSTTLGDLRQPPGIYLIGSPDPEKLAATLKVALSVVAPGPDGIKDREFLGRKIYSLTLPFSPQGGSHSYHFAASGGYVGITGDVQMLEEYLRSGEGKAAGLNQTPGLSDAAQKAGGLEAGIFAFSNDKENMRDIVETLRKEQISWSDFLGLFGAQLTLGKISTVEEASQFKKWADFSLLPPVDALTKYFSYSVWAGGFTPEGFSLNYFTPAPPALR
jgi:hypothetical protein